MLIETGSGNEFTELEGVKNGQGWTKNRAKQISVPEILNTEEGRFMGLQERVVRHYSVEDTDKRFLYVLSHCYKGA